MATEKGKKGEGKKADHLVAYGVRKFKSGEAEKSSWTRIGVAFPNKDGKGFNVEMDYWPKDGKFVLREPQADEGKE